MFVKKHAIVAVALLFVGSAFAVDASFDDDPLGINVYYVDELDYQGAVYTSFSGTADESWLIHASDYSPFVSRVDVDSTTMGSTVYVPKDTEESTTVSFSVAAWSYVEEISPYAFLLSLYHDEDGDGEYDSQDDDLMDTVWAYLY